MKKLSLCILLLFTIASYSQVEEQLKVFSTITIVNGNDVYIHKMQTFFFVNYEGVKYRLKIEFDNKSAVFDKLGVSEYGVTESGYPYELIYIQNRRTKEILTLQYFQEFDAIRLIFYDTNINIEFTNN
jgi:hypothetical protein